MIIKNRIIPCLLVSNRRLIKTIKFNKEKYVGDPINAIRIFNEKEVDELIVLDILASKKKIEPDYEMIEKLAEECFMPLCYGGGITSIEQAQRIFSLGIEKISINSAYYDSELNVGDISKLFGAQSIVLSIDVKKNILGQYRVYHSGKKKILSIQLKDLLNSKIIEQVGELLINSVDKDGTMDGPDLELIKTVSDSVSVPVIGIGGVGSLQDIKNVINNGASGVSAGSFFVFNGKHKAVLITYPTTQEINDIYK